ncbi:hypothetical protein [Pendulispora albinea]|uniref:PKD/Chitinase domain-containing protein n=1 Tax=Pendulispora albinea TaxID=2741071 RepID=A0ABZ2LPG6_9BACT
MNTRLTIFAIRRLATTAGALVAFASAGCAQHEQPADEKFGKVGIVASAVTPRESITSLVIASGTATANLSYDSGKGKYTGAIVLPVGQQTITAKAYAGAQQVGFGTANVIIEANKTATLSLRMLDTTGAQPHVDAGPYIVAISSSSTEPVTGQPITLTANALDAEGDTLSYAWTSDCGGTFGSASAAITTWQTAATGPCKITATVTSKDLTDAESLDLVVFEPNAAKGAAAVDVDYVPNPIVTSIYLNSTPPCSVATYSFNSMCPAPVAKAPFYVGIGLVTYTGHTVSLTDDCGGTVEEQSLGYYQYQPGTGLCTLTAKVTDAYGLSSSLSASVYVKQP